MQQLFTAGGIIFLIGKNAGEAKLRPGVVQQEGFRMFETAFTIEWGDCDEAGIVFYPNYFYWFDCTYQRWLRKRGLSQRELRRRFSSVTPLVNVGAQFVGPACYDDELVVGAEVIEWQERRFRIDYKLSVGKVQVASGFEHRAWASVANTGELRGASVPPEFKELLK
jgi:YbgC/YbaW family acyl-CoA thioester hydrolase